MATRKAGVLVFVEAPSSTAARWQEPKVAANVAEALVAAAHEDLAASLAAAAETQIYLAPLATDDAEYAAELATSSNFEVLDVPPALPLHRWASGLSILYNRCGHRKIVCADGRVPDVYPEDLGRALKKLDLYEMVVGREGEDRCWLIGMNGYSEVLERTETQPEDQFHPILHAAGQAGLKVSVLDTKRALGGTADLEHLRQLASTPRHPHLRQVLEQSGLGGGASSSRA